MGIRRDDTENRAFGHGLPGTGGDVVRRDDDVEGHMRRSADDEAGPRASRPFGEDGVLPTDVDDDVEGHLYTGGPSTQGEKFNDPYPMPAPFSKRAPGENPHGEH